MKKFLGFVVLSLFAISVSAADLMASSTAPTVTQNIVVEGAACPGVGATGFSSTGLLLSCQSGVWKGSGGSSAYALGQPGWWCDKESGYTMQWGAGPALGVDASTYVTFPRTMTTSYSATGTGIGAPSGGNGPTLQVRSLTGSGFIMSNDYYSTSGFYWFATGYTPSC